MKMVQAPDWKPLVLDRLLVYDLKNRCNVTALA